MSDPDQFETFWRTFPRHTAKGLARKAYAKASLKVAPAVILAALLAQIDAGGFPDDPKFIPHPATWLNQERYEDEILPRRRTAFRNGALELLAREMEGQWREPVDGVGDDLRYLGAPDA